MPSAVSAPSAQVQGGAALTPRATGLHQTGNEICGYESPTQITLIFKQLTWGLSFFHPHVLEEDRNICAHRVVWDWDL